MKGCHGQVFLVISFSRGAFLCLPRVKTMVTEKLASAWVTVSVPRQLVDWLTDDDECYLKEQKAVFPFWNHSNLDNIGQESDISKFNVHSISKYANNIKTTTHQNPRTLISVKVIQTSESSFSTCTDATSPGWWNDTGENTGMQIPANDNHRNFYTCTIISLTLFYCKFYWRMGNVHSGSHNSKFIFYYMWIRPTP